MEDHFVQIGKRETWGNAQPFGLFRADRRQHTYIIGKTGSGKSTLLRNLILQDIEAGEGVGLIDPHGDLALDLLEHIPPSRTDHVVYFDPSDLDFPIGLNLLCEVPADRRHLVVSGVIGAMKSVWRESWGPRLEYILAAALSALTECQNVSLLGVQRMLVDERYRQWVLRQVRDPVVRQFWLEEFAGYDARLRAEAIAPIQNKLGALLLASPLRNILGQVRSGIDARFIMDNRRIFIANLSKGKLGADKANLLGAILVTQFQLAALARADLPEDQRIDFFLAIDEFHNFSTDSFASILSEARKYRLSMLLAHQYIEQLTDEVRDAIFGNVGSLISFRVSETNAEVLYREFGRTYLPTTLSSLGNYEICAKLLAGGQHNDPFLGVTLPPGGTRHGRAANLVERSRERYAASRAVVEDRIRRWMQGR
jgi:energy-coupling factor transporter ATP-binding protein EcfA2